MVTTSSQHLTISSDELVAVDLPRHTYSLKGAAGREYSFIRRRKIVNRARHAFGRHDTACDNCSNVKVAVYHHLACTLEGP